MGLEIRQLTIDDTAAAAAVMRRSFEERLPNLAVLHTPEEDAGFVGGHLFQSSEMWGAFDPELVGFIAFTDGWIEQFYILPTWQGRGIGNALLAIPMTKFDKLKLWTFQQNLGARQFYERKGFVAMELTDGQANEHKEPDILYQWVREKRAG